MLGGEQDTLVPPWMTRWTRRLLNAETKLLPTLAHAMMVEPDWQETAKAIQRWLKKNLSERKGRCESSARSWNKDGFAPLDSSCS